MKLIASLAVALGILAASAHNASAAQYLVDTGTPTGNFVRGDEVLPNIAFALNGNGYCGTETNCATWLAGEFVLDSRSMLHGIEGFFQADADHGGAIRATIYSDGGDTPGARLFTADFFVPSYASGEWYGVSGLHWMLSAGTYWVGFEVLSNSTFSGGMLCCAPNPLLQEAFTRGPAQDWFSDDTIDIGVRISGRAIPEPATMWLIASAILMMAWLRRRSTIAGPGL